MATVWRFPPVAPAVRAGDVTDCAEVSAASVAVEPPAGIRIFWPILRRSGSTVGFALAMSCHLLLSLKYFCASASNVSPEAITCVRSELDDEAPVVGVPPDGPVAPKPPVFDVVGVEPVGSPAPVGVGLPVARLVPPEVVVGAPAPDAPEFVALPDAEPEAGMVMPFTMRGAAVLVGLPTPGLVPPVLVFVFELVAIAAPFVLEKPFVPGAHFVTPLVVPMFVVPLGTSPLPVPAFVAAPGTNGGCGRAPALAMVPVGVGEVPAPAAFVAVPEVLAVPGTVGVTVGVNVSVGGMLVWLFEATAPVVDGAPLSFAVVDDLLLEADGVEAM